MNATIVNKGNGYKVVSIQDAEIVGFPGSVWRKFKGVPTDNGLKHSFVISIDEQYVEMLRSMNFEVNYYNKEGRDPFYYLTITLSWRFKDPEVYIVSNNMVETKMNEETIGDLDQFNNIQTVDMEIRASHYNSHGREGFTTYANDVYFYLGAPAASSMRYEERRREYYENVAVDRGPIQPELPNMPAPIMEMDTEDIPF